MRKKSFFRAVMHYTRAKELLLENNLSITTIAYKTGFESLSYFYRAFKKFTKINPTEFHTDLKY